MSDEVGTAVVDAVEPSQVDIPADVPNESTDAIAPKPEEQERLDGRKQPDALKKHISDLRRQAETLTDPAEKKAALDRIKFLYDTSGKARAYEELYPKVSEAREVKALLDSVGGRDGVIQMQSVFSEVEKFNQQLTVGDPKAVEQLWADAPDGMPKLVPAMLERLAKDKPEVYAQAITPHALNIVENAGFLTSVGTILQELGKQNPSADEIYKIAKGMEGWFNSQRQSFKQQQEAKVDPRVEELQKQIAERDEKDRAAKVDTAYNAVVTHAGPTIDTVLKPMVSKLGLTPEAYTALRNNVWNHLQDSRNTNETYKTIAPSKQKQGYDQWTEYAKRWTTDNAEASARAMVKTYYAHQLQNGTQVAKPVTAPPGVTPIQRGAAPTAAEIDYGPKGKAAALKAGFKDLEDMILSGQAPLKAGGIRRWR